LAPSISTSASSGRRPGDGLSRRFRFRQIHGGPGNDNDHLGPRVRPAFIRPRDDLNPQPRFGRSDAPRAST
jgi:hypothetical protein